MEEFKHSYESLTYLLGFSSGCLTSFSKKAKIFDSIEDELKLYMNITLAVHAVVRNSLYNGNSPSSRAEDNITASVVTIAKMMSVAKGNPRYVEAVRVCGDMVNHDVQRKLITEDFYQLNLILTRWLKGDKTLENIIRVLKNIYDGVGDNAGLYVFALLMNVITEYFAADLWEKKIAMRVYKKNVGLFFTDYDENKKPC